MTRFRLERDSPFEIDAPSPTAVETRRLDLYIALVVRDKLVSCDSYNAGSHHRGMS
jgi:hypothetical protein